MPTRLIALADSDEEDVKYPLRTSKVPAWRASDSDDEVDELESEREGDPVPPPRRSPRRPPPRASRPTIGAREDGQKDKTNVQKRRKEEAREEKRKRRKAEKKAAAIAARSNGDASGSSRPRATKSPSVNPVSGPSAASQRPTAGRATQASHGTQNPTVVNVDSGDSDPPLPYLVIRPSASQQKQTTTKHPDPMSEDEVELLATQPAESDNATSTSARSSSLPNLTDSAQIVVPSQRAASAHPPAFGDSGDAANPTQLDSSDAPYQPSMETEPGDDGNISDVSSVSYSDSEEYEEGAYFYTSSEGSLHGSDSEEGLASWTKYDQENWQGSTAHLDDAYDGTFDIRAVIDHRKNPRRGFYEYRTVWAGYPQYSNSWEPEWHFDNPRTLEEYWARRGGRPYDCPEDHLQHSSHDSDTDLAINRRPRQRAHEALRKRRRQLRRDKVLLRQYMASLDESKARQKARQKARFEERRREKRLTLDTHRVQEKGSTSGHQRRLEKLAQKRKWKRQSGAGGGPSDAAGASRFSTTHANRALADVSMKGRSSAASGANSAHTRVSQLDDSIPDNDDNQIVFRRSAPNYPGLSAPMAPIRQHPGFTSASSRPMGAPSSAAAAMAGASSSTSSQQPPAPRPVPGSYRGAHRREPKVQMKQDFGQFLDKLHSGSSSAAPGSSNSNTAQPLQAPTDSSGRPITARRRPSEARKPNLLVLKPVEDFKGGSRPVASAYAGSSASSDAGDKDAFGVPEMSAVRSQFNPHQEAPDTDEEAKRARQAPTSILKSAPATNAGASKQGSVSFAGPSQHGASRTRVEDPRRRPTSLAAETQDLAQGTWSPPDNSGQWSPNAPAFTPHGKASNDTRPPMPTVDRSPLEQSSTSRTHDGTSGKGPQYQVWKGWFEFDVGHSRIDTEGSLYAVESLSSERMQTLGLGSEGDTVQFNMVMPFAWIRDMLAGHSAGHAVATDEVMVLEASGLSARLARSSLDQLSEQLKHLDIALLANASESAMAGGATTSNRYIVAFSSKYDLDYISGVPHSLRHVCGRPYTVCVVALQLEHHPAPSLLISSEWPPPLEAPVNNVFEAAIGKKTIEDLNIGRNEIRKVKRAAQRYRISTQMYEGIRSRYNVLFLGQNPPAYEKSVSYYMVRIFEGGVRLNLNPEKDSKLWKDAKISTNVFVRRAALEESVVSDEDGKILWLAAYLRRFKRQPRCRFWSFGFSPEDPDERVREIFPNRDGLVTFSISSILADLVRSSMTNLAEVESPEREEGQLTQTDKTPPESILCHVAYHLPDDWRVRVHPWVRPCLKLLADHLEAVCRALHLLKEDQEFPIELMLDLDSKLEVLYTSALVEEWSMDEISGLPYEEPTEVPDQPEELVERIDNEVLATLHKAQLHTASHTRFHVLVSQQKDMTEEQLAGVEAVSLVAVGEDACLKLAELPGN